MYVDREPGWHTLGELGLQVVWILVLVALAGFVWRRAIRRLVVFGG
jgi:ABC-2 type transport system permease protein